MGHWKKVLTAGLVTLGLATTGAQAVTIVNGGFEIGPNPGATFITLTAFDTSITGWTVGPHSIDYIGGYWQPSEGSRSIDLSGDAAGSVSQVITGLTPGQRYTIGFDMAGNPDAGPDEKTMGVSAFVGEQIYTFDAGETTRADMQWEHHSLTFLALTNSTTLTFRSLTLTAFGPALDNVSISPVPVPAALPLFASALGAAALFGFRRKRKAAA